MKKQTMNNKLAFNKAAVTELNENALNAINGGSSTGCVCDAVAEVIKDAISQMTRPIVNQL